MTTVREEIWRPGDGPGLPVVTLEVDGARCRIAPQLGFNCLSWEVETPTGWRELLWTAPDIDVNPVPTRSGIPILFPFPNRIRDGRFSWNDKNYQLPINDPQQKNAIHGFVCYRPWKVRALEKEGGVCEKQILEAEFDSRGVPELRGTWPSEYRCTAKYTLTRHTLELDFHVANKGPTDMPFGLGTHAYWRANVSKARIRACWYPKGKARLKAWELRELLPMGTFRSLTLTEAKVQDGTELGDDALDTVLQTENCPLGMFWSLTERSQDHEVTLLLGSPEPFQTFVLFTPQHREAVCIEPYTCTTDAVNLHPQGIQTGLLTLPPGHTWQTSQLWHVRCRLLQGAP